MPDATPIARIRGGYELRPTSTLPLSEIGRVFDRRDVNPITGTLYLGHGRMILPHNSTIRIGGVDRKGPILELKGPYGLAFELDIKYLPVRDTIAVLDRGRREVLFVELTSPETITPVTYVTLTSSGLSIIMTPFAEVRDRRVKEAVKQGARLQKEANFPGSIRA